jgi:hypothetical protein
MNTPRIRKWLLVLLAAVLASTAFAAPKSAAAQGPGDAFPIQAEVAKALIDALLINTGLEGTDVLREIVSGKTLKQIIQETGANEATILADAKAQTLLTLDQAVADGKLSQAQADTYKADLDKMLERSLQAGQVISAMAANRGNRQTLEAALKIISEATGLTAEQLQQELATGKTLSAILTEKGADVAAVTAQLKAVLSEAINKAQTEGTISKAIADRMLANLDRTINRLLNTDLSKRINKGQNRRQNRTGMVIEGLASTLLIRATADATGLSQRAVVQGLRDQKSLRQIATENNADPAVIITAVEKTFTTQLQALLNNNRITQEQYDATINGLSGALNAKMDQQGLQAGRGRRNK